MNSCIFRLRRAYQRKIEFGYIVPSFIGAVFCLMVSNGKLSNTGIDIVQNRDSEFTIGFRNAILSGICLGKVSRIS